MIENQTKKVDAYPYRHLTGPSTTTAQLNEEAKPGEYYGGWILPEYLDPIAIGSNLDADSNTTQMDSEEG